MVGCSFSIPVIDISPWTVGGDRGSSEEERQAVAQAVGRACREVGFFAIICHGIDEEILDAAWKSAADFFDLPIESKLKSKSASDVDYPYGYENSEILSVGKQRDNLNKKGIDITGDATVLGAAVPDAKETFAIGPYNPSAGMPARQWPVDAPPEFQASLSAYYQAMEGLASTLLQILAMALDLLSVHWFDERLDHHLSALRILNYFPVEKSQILPGQLRASAHTDYGALTILKSGGPGLQVKKDVASDAWVDVPHLPNSFIINLGDMMRRWTNDKWLSTLHRVVFTEGYAERRQSIAYFCNVNGDCIVDPKDLSPNEIPKYSPVSARDHLMAKHLASMGVSD